MLSRSPRRLSTALLFALSLAGLTPALLAAQSRSVHLPGRWSVWVDDDYSSATPGWGITRFQQVQAAIDAVGSGGKVHVAPGIYQELILIAKPVHLLGSGPARSILDGRSPSGGDVLHVAAEGVTITGFTLRNSGPGWDDAGIDVRADHSTIEGNVIEKTKNGIAVYSSRNIIRHNWIHHNANDGIVFAGDCDENLVVGNRSEYNGHIGIHRGSPDLPGQPGFSHNVILENVLAYNDFRGLCKLGPSEETLVAHNYFIGNKERNAFDDVPSDHWDLGYPSGGNWFADYSGSDLYHGPNQDLPGPDGLGDVPYVLTDPVQDRYPLMVPWGQELTADAGGISASVGGTLRLALQAGPSSASRPYVIMASLSGTDAGIPLPGDTQRLPLHPDPLTLLVLAGAGQPPFEEFLGTLDATGRATATLALPPLPPGFVDRNLVFAFAAAAPWSFASNPCNIRILP